MAVRKRAPVLSPASVGGPIGVDPDGRGPADARLAGSGTLVWALVASYFGGAGLDAARVASDYVQSPEAEAAALAYFAEHREPVLAGSPSTTPPDGGGGRPLPRRGRAGRRGKSA